MTLMGNVPRSTSACAERPRWCSASASAIVADAASPGLILSVGGGVSPGMPKENIRALAAQSRAGRIST